MAEKSYDVLAAQIDKLVKEREDMKEKKLGILFETFTHAFDSNLFQEKILRTSNTDLKTIATYIVTNFDSISEQALLEKDQKKSSNRKSKKS